MSRDPDLETVNRTLNRHGKVYWFLSSQVQKLMAELKDADAVIRSLRAELAEAPEVCGPGKGTRVSEKDRPTDRPNASDCEQCAALRAEVERLREWNREIALNAREFAAENEHLRAALRQVAAYKADDDEMDWADAVLTMNAIARAALEGK